MQFIEIVAYSPDIIDIRTHNSETAKFLYKKHTLYKTKAIRMQKNGEDN